MRRRKAWIRFIAFATSVVLAMTTTVSVLAEEGQSVEKISPLDEALLVEESAEFEEDVSDAQILDQEESSLAEETDEFSDFDTETDSDEDADELNGLNESEEPVVEDNEQELLESESEETEEFIEEDTAADNEQIIEADYTDFEDIDETDESEEIGITEYSNEDLEETSIQDEETETDDAEELLETVEGTQTDELGETEKEIDLENIENIESTDELIDEESIRETSGFGEIENIEEEAEEGVDETEESLQDDSEIDETTSNKEQISDNVENDDEYEEGIGITTAFDFDKEAYDGEIYEDSDKLDDGSIIQEESVSLNEEIDDTRNAESELQDEREYEIDINPTSDKKNNQDDIEDELLLEENKTGGESTSNDLENIKENNNKNANATNINSAKKPHDINFEMIENHEEDMPLQAPEYFASIDNIRKRNTRKILLIQSDEPWSSDANEKLLEQLRIGSYITDYTIASVEDAAYEDFSEYSLIMFASDQTAESYDEYESIRLSVESYAYNGGAVLFSACDSGWQDSEINFPLPAGVSKYESFSDNNYIASANNPVVTGILTDGRNLTDSMLFGNFCSHVCFSPSTIPADSTVILRSSDSNDPTLIACPYGTGHVILSGVTWEFAYKYDDEYDYAYDYAIAYDDLIIYALTLSDYKDGVENPLSIQLENRIIDYENKDFDYFEITAIVTNDEASNNLETVFARLDQGKGSYIYEGTNPQIVDILEINNSIEFKWIISIDKSEYKDGGIYIYSVASGSEKTIPIIQQGSIAIGSSNGISNELDFSHDVWDFKNYSHGPFEYNEKDKTALLQGLSASEKTRIKKVINDWQRNGLNGHCFGMSSLVILEKMNIIDISGNEGKKDLRSVKKTDEIERLICYYLFLQNFKPFHAEAQRFLSMTIEEEISEIAEKADKVKNGGSPVLLCFGVNGDGDDGWAHAVVAYAVEPVSYKSPKSKVTYNHRILLYDSNVKDWKKNNCLYYNQGTNEWEIPYYVEGQDKGLIYKNSQAYLLSAVNDLNVIDSKNRKIGQENYKAELECKSKTKMIMASGDSSWVIDAEKGIVSGDSVLTVYRDVASNGDGDGSLYVVLPDNEAEYSFSTFSNKAEKLNLNILFENKYTSFESNAAKGGVLGGSGFVRIIGNEGHFSTVVADDNTASEEFYAYTLSGDNKGDIELSLNDRGAEVSGDNIKGLLLAAENDNNSMDGIIEENSIAQFGNTEKNFSEKYYTITYNLNGGKVSGNPTNITVDTENFTLKNPKKAGYVFIGWTGSNGKTPQKIVEIKKGTKEALFFNANWAIGLASANVTIKQTSYVYDGKEKKPTVKVALNGNPLKKGKDFTVTYKANTNAGTAKVTITGKGGYTGTKTITFKITKAAQPLKAKAKKSVLPVTAKTTLTISGNKGKVTYKSGNTKIATVSKKGAITAKKVGTVKITITAAAKGNYKKTTKTITIKVTPAKTSKLTLANTAKGVKLTWKKVAGATGYYVFRNGKKIANIKKGSTITYTDKKGKTNGAKYQYQIYPYAKTGKGAGSANKTIYFLTTPKLTNATNSAAKKITVKWKKNAKATGYEVKYVLGKTSKTKKIKKKATVKAVLTSLKKGKTYKVSVRTYKTVGKNTYYSPWSAVKSVKIKK